MEPPGPTPSHSTWHALQGISRDYAGKVRLFRPNARLYLLAIIINGLALGVFRLLFNFYVLSLGYDEALLGQLLTTTSLVSLLSALPAGYFSDRMGRKPALVAAAVILSAAVAGMVVWQQAIGLFAMNVLLGLGQSLSGVTLGPFLMENSGEEERTYLFSFSLGVQMIATFAGNWLGGKLPAWVGGMVAADATSATAYGWSLAAVAAISALGLLPLALLRRRRQDLVDDRPMLSPFQYARRNPRLLGKLITPLLITSLGAGLLMPFMNVFFRRTFDSSDSTIGTLFATGSLAMAAGLLVAPPLADKLGKMRVVVITQALSIPFLALLGFAPWFWLSAAAYLVRLALMNMSNPVYQTFVMEQVEEEARATVASLTSMSWNVGWAFSPTVSGWLQVNYGFDPVYLGTISTYVIAIYLYWRFFVRGSEPAAGAQTEKPA
jgi:MFS family permease